MPYYRDEDAVNDFDEYDPTPYSGGYDIHLTYGRPLPPCEETCYPPLTDDFDYDRPQYSSHSEPSAYADEALDVEYSSYVRHKPRPGPAYGFNPGGGHPQGERPEPAPYGFQPEAQRHESEEPSSEYGSGYGRKTEYESSGYVASEYVKPSYGGDDESPKKPSYGNPSYGSQEGEYGRSSYGRSEEEGYRKPSYERRDDDDEDRPKYGYSEERHGRKKYGGDGSDDDEEKKQSRYKQGSDNEDDEEKRRSRYNKQGSDDDEENKHPRYKHHHHHRKSYDDE
uniref:Uncharacterized protein n=1 Tax=Cannabis sativa TaxID=3483 RepID=A0A803QMI9_CANSA